MTSIASINSATDSTLITQEQAKIKLSRLPQELWNKIFIDYLAIPPSSQREIVNARQLDIDDNGADNRADLVQADRVDLNDIAHSYLAFSADKTPSEEESKTTNSEHAAAISLEIFAKETKQERKKVLADIQQLFGEEHTLKNVSAGIRYFMHFVFPRLENTDGGSRPSNKEIKLAYQKYLVESFVQAKFPQIVFHQPYIGTTVFSYQENDLSYKDCLNATWARLLIWSVENAKEYEPLLTHAQVWDNKGVVRRFALYKAISGGHEKALERLLNDPHIDTWDNQGTGRREALMDAVLSNKEKALERLLNDPHIDTWDTEKKGRTRALDSATFIEQTTIVERLFTNLNLKTWRDYSLNDYENALVDAASHGKEGSLRIFLHDPKIETRDRYGLQRQFALEKAGAERQEKTIELLLNDPNIINWDNSGSARLKTLEHALFKGAEKIIERLLSDPNINTEWDANGDGRCNFLKKAASDEKEKALEQLLKDPHIEVWDNDRSARRNALIEAVTQGKEKTVETFLNDPKIEIWDDLAAARGIALALVTSGTIIRISESSQRRIAKRLLNNPNQMTIEKMRSYSRHVLDYSWR